MPNYGPPSKLTPARLRGLAQSLTEIADKFGQFAGQIDESDERALWVFGSPTAQRALKQMRSFVGQIEESIDATHVGQPYTEGSRKTHHGVTTPAAELTDEEVAIRDEGLRDIQRSVMKSRVADNQSDYRERKTGND